MLLRLRFGLGLLLVRSASWLAGWGFQVEQPGEREPFTEEEVEALGWWTLPGAVLLDALRDVAEGADPDLLYGELYANCEHTHPAEGD